MQNPAAFLFRPRAPLCKCAPLWAVLLLWGGDQHIFSVATKTGIVESTKKHRVNLPLSHESSYFASPLDRAPVLRQRDLGTEIRT